MTIVGGDLKGQILPRDCDECEWMNMTPFFLLRW